MDSTAGLPDKQPLSETSLTASSKQPMAHTRQIVAFTLWVLGFMLLLVACVLVYFHPGPWPIDLQTTITLQHLQLWSWVITSIGWVTKVGDPIPSVIYPTVWLVVLLLIGVSVWRRGRSSMPWFVTAIFIWLGTFVMFSLFFLIDFIVARPRPSSPLIHVFIPEPIPSFPSGHVVYTVVFYGFLLYLSLTKPVSQWRYRWVLIPFQLYAALYILLIGFSRVYEGSHWLTDALGGYLAGTLFLALLIFLYGWTLDRLIKRRARRLQQQSTQIQQA